MSAPTTHQQDSSLSAASFLASISAECSTSFGSTGSSAASSAPSLPISAKVSLIDAQIDALECRIEEAVASHADELRRRAASTRSVDHDLNQLWRYINQTSSRLVTAGSQLAPIASEYHEALAQSSKQGLLISILSDLLAATKHLERLEKLQHQNDLTTLRAELPKATTLMQPFRSRSALQSMPAVVELRARFERLESRCKQADEEVESRSVEPSAPTAAPAQPRASLEQSHANHQKASDTANDTASALSPALKVLESARALIVARGSEGGWKEVRIKLDAPAPPPPTMTPAAAEPPAQPAVNSNRSSLDTRAERILHEDSAPGSASLTRNSSTSSATNARNRHKPKLGARVIRPQDQLGSGPFNAEEAALEEDGWGLDDDENEATQSIPPATHSHVNQPVHQAVASLARASHNSSPSGSVAMQGSMSSSSSQRSAFAVQESETSADAAGLGDGIDAWGLGEDEDAPEADGWGLDEDIPQLRPASPKRTKRASVLVRHAPAPTIASAVTDAWDLDEEDIPEEVPASSRREEVLEQAPTESATLPATIKDAAATADDSWNLEEDTGPQQLPTTPQKQETSVQASSEPQAAATTSTVPTTTQDAGILEEDATPDPVALSPEKPEAPVLQPVTQPEVDVAPAKAANEDVWDLENDDVSQQPPQHPAPTQFKEEETHAKAAVEDLPVPATSIGAADQPGWNLEQDADIDVDDDPWATDDQPKEAVQTEPAHQPKATSPQQPNETARAPLQSPEAASTTQPAPTSAAKQHGDEPEEDAWAFEEGSSASEADKADVAAVTSLQNTAVPVTSSSSAQPSHNGPSQEQSSAELVLAATAAKSISNNTSAPAAQQPKPVASPPSSPGGWGEDFSDSESTGVPASASQASLTASKSLQAESSSQAARPTKAAPAVLKEECTISQRSLDLVKLAESTMASVVSLLESGSQGSEEAESLAGTIFKIFELHRALMPVAHGEVLRDVPSLAMQFFNDCEYLARELTRLVSDKGEAISSAWSAHDADVAKRWKTKELPKLEQEAALTRALGQRWFEAQMTAQSKILLDTLMEADGFARTFDDNRFVRCERCIKQVVQTLQQLDKAWRPVLVPSRFHAAIGRLVDLVFQKVLHDVLDLEDIGETESEKLASLVKTLGSLESVFTTTDGQSTAPFWVPSWFKTSYLIEILTGSLVDIEFLAFEAGALVDYSRKELTGLIKALFADTPNRSKLLRRIEGANVDVLAH